MATNFNNLKDNANQSTIEKTKKIEDKSKPKDSVNKPNPAPVKKSRGRPKTIAEDTGYFMLRVKDKTHARLTLAKTLDQQKTMDDFLNHVLDTYTPKNISKEAFQTLMQEWSVTKDRN